MLKCHMKKHLGISCMVATLVLLGALAVINSPKKFYPIIGIEAPFDRRPNLGQESAAGKRSLSMGFMFDAKPSLQSCEALTGNVVRVALAKCPRCTVHRLECSRDLDRTNQQLLSEAPLRRASARMTSGVIVFSASDPDLELDMCRETEAQSMGGPQEIRCYAPNTKRIKPMPKRIEAAQAGISLVALMVAGIGAWLICWLIIKYEYMHAHFSQDPIDSGPQKVHAVPTPRIGGIAIVGALIAAGGGMMVIDVLPREYGLLLLAAMPAFLGGLVEDVTKKVGVFERLLLTMLSGAAAAWLVGAILIRLEIPGVDQALLWLPLAVVVSVFAIGGVTNAMNIIDGYNGLASGYGLLVSIAIAWVAGQVGDTLVFKAGLALSGALVGFLCWNWPTGKIFLGDGGAYLLGFMLAVLSVLLVARNASVSPWFPLVLLIYPVFETIFSIYRRRYLREQSPGEPDCLHFHHLIFQWLLRGSAEEGQPLMKSRMNNMVAAYIFAMALVFIVPAMVLWRHTLWLMGLTLIFCVFYVWTYRRIMHWRALDWVR